MSRIYVNNNMSLHDSTNVLSIDEKRKLVIEIELCFANLPNLMSLLLQKEADTSVFYVDASVLSAAIGDWVVENVQC